MLIFATALVAATPLDPKDIKGAAPVCQQIMVRRAGGVSSPPPVRRLDREPAANLYSAVLYSEGNCTKPVVIRAQAGDNKGR